MHILYTRICAGAYWEYMLSLAIGWTWGHGPVAALPPLSDCNWQASNRHTGPDQRSSILASDKQVLINRKLNQQGQHLVYPKYLSIFQKFVAWRLPEMVYLKAVDRLLCRCTIVI